MTRPACQREVETLPHALAAEVLELEPPILDGLIAAGLVHAIPTVSGSLQVCKELLFSREE
jgi:hypothetical protein